VPQPLLRLISHLFGSIALARRRWYVAHPQARRRLERPVVSIGNLSLGGTGKTPLVAAVARLLAETGERPAILSRGYKRRRSPEGVVVVSDGTSLRTDVAHAGDEPFMLAQAIPNTAVLVSSDRYLAGRLAETQLGCTVHVLDDGFQHFGLARDIDLLIVTSGDLDNPNPLPLGRLREPLAVAPAADAVLVSSAEPRDPAEMARELEVAQWFRVDRTIEAPRTMANHRSAGNEPAALEMPGPVFAIAGIANPQRFFDDLTRAGWHLVGTRRFADHHQFGAEDIAGVVRAAQSAGAQAVLTTEKDMVRLAGHARGLPSSPSAPAPRAAARRLVSWFAWGPAPAPAAGAHVESPTPLSDLGSPIPFFWVPLRVTLDPAFASWLRDGLARAPGAGERAGS